MTQRRKTFFLAGVLAVAAIAAAGFLYSIGRVPWPRRQNVVLIVIDTLRADHLPQYGYQRRTAPFMMRFTDDAAQFDCVSPTSWTKPAVASIFTGLHPVRHQTYGRTDVLPSSIPTIASILRDNGYTTMGAASNGWVSKDFGMDRGFDAFTVFDAPDALETTPDAERVNATVVPTIHWWKRQPFFMYVHYSDPHSPYRPSTTWDGQPLPADMRKGITTDDLDASTAATRPAATVQKAIDLYDGEIRQADDAVAELLGQLKKSNLLKNTIVIITADHGEELEDHGRFGHGQTLLNEVTHVPLLIAGPGIPAGRRHGLASLLDITPSILDYLNIASGDRAVDGVSLVPTLANADIEVPARDLLYQLDYQDASKVGGQVVKISRAGLAFEADMQKFVINKNPYQQGLFDQKTDPGERQDRIDQQPEVAAKLAGRLADMYNAYSHRRAQRVTVVASSETRRAVLALGYLSGADQTEQRNIPPGIQPAGPGGALGWMGAVHGCITTNDPDKESQLVKGWSYAEKEGRWTEQEATAILATEDRTDQHLTVSGINHRPDAFTLTISIDGTPLTRVKPPPGPYRLTMAIPPSIKAGRHVVSVATDSVFQPSAHGQGDTRSLGIFVSSICVE